MFIIQNTKRHLLLITFTLLLSTRLINCMQIDRVILATNDNPSYIAFWPLIAKAWTQMGVKPTLALIGGKNVQIDESLGDVIRFEPIPNIPTGYQAQVIRLLLPAYFENKVCMTSDIDMLPLNKEFLIDSIKDISDDNFVLYNNKQYEEILQIAPICYVVGKGSTFKEIFQIQDKNHIQQIIKYWHDLALHLTPPSHLSDEKKAHWTINMVWLTDERMLTAYLKIWEHFSSRCVMLNNTFERLIDRDNWKYNKDLLNKGYYRDAHLPKPLSNPQNKETIKQLLIDANLTHLIQTIE